MTSPPSSSSRFPSPGRPDQWACARCTLCNPGSLAACDACGAARPEASDLGAVAGGSSLPPQWICARCTLSNPKSLATCGACAAARPAEVEAADDADALDLSAIAGAAFLPLRGCSRKRARAASPDVVVDEGAGSDQKEETTAEKEEVNAEAHLDKKTIKVMTYNLWFREDLELSKRMKAIGDLIQHHDPDLICFQEVTSNIYQLLQKSGWWQEYKCTLSDNLAMYMDRPYFCMQMSKLPVISVKCLPFGNSIMGRELSISEIKIEGAIKLVLATSHLESPCRWDQMYSKERVTQANESMRILGRFRNVIFGGDMNWDDKGDGPFPLPDGWTDPWDELKPGDEGWTYDTKANGMLTGNRKLQKRMDRFVCKLPDFKIDAIEMIGKEAIPGLSYMKEKKVGKNVRQLELPVLPSDHFGLVLSISYGPSG
ncbi:uncharacterized protein LOC124685829 [Lolium rigidum]|uniref:uncharacterized protein LOC124685829 n=1 Tax=Lolium rigidum TaxID=89674 RepID=UPI001F5E11D7|nr:uncharacterized protein LOC124685829 [Lolium rigidum]